MTLATILDVQKHLAAAGFDPGPLDGMDGPQTQAALGAFNARVKVILTKPKTATLGWPKENGMNAYYGNPDLNGDGRADVNWEKDNIRVLAPPYRMVLAWDKSQSVKAIRVNKKCAESLLRILHAIKAHYGTQEALERARMHLYGGCYNFRLKRGGSSLSVHSWGAAIDIDPELNSFGKKYNANAGMMPQAVVKIFEAEGWVWGGLWRKGDAMHFQAAKL